MSKPSATVDGFKAAWEWFKKRVPLGEKQMRALEHRAEKRAFHVAGVTQLRVLDTVFKGIERALKDGTTFADFKKEHGPALISQWKGSVANPSARMETIFRTNLQTAYSAGRMRELRDPDTMVARPYWMLDALLDLRTTTLCKTLNGTILPADAGWWRTHTPPLHYNCRTAIRSLSREGAADRGGITVPSNLLPPGGFGTLDDEPPASDLSDVAPELQVIYSAKLARRRRSRK